MKILSILILVTFLSQSPLKAQDSTTYDQQLWLEGMLDYRFGVKMDFFADASYRKIFSKNDNLWRVMARPSLKYKILKWLDVRGGIGVFYTNINEENNLLELRPWQGVAVVWPSIKGVNFTHLVRIEQQIVYNTSNWNHAYANRYRYQLSTKINLSNKRKYNIFFIPLAVEFFFRNDAELDKFLRNQGRYTIGLGYVFSREITVDAKFFIQRSRSDEINFSISDQVFRLRFRYNLFSEEEDETKL